MNLLVIATVSMLTWSAPGLSFAAEPPKPHKKAESHKDHQHKKECGHPSKKHGDHEDFEHDGHQHRKHGDHYDECSAEKSE
jgi:hypothetical protein